MNILVMGYLDPNIVFLQYFHQAQMLYYLFNKYLGNKSQTVKLLITTG